jgi:hypothetical protein
VHEFVFVQACVCVHTQPIFKHVSCSCKRLHNAQPGLLDTQILDIFIYTTIQSSRGSQNAFSIAMNEHLLPLPLSAELDPLSTELDLEVKSLRQGLLQAVDEHAQVVAGLKAAGTCVYVCFEHGWCAFFG